MSKHTQGQWTAAGTAGHKTHGQSAVYDESGKDIAIVYDGEANACLIAASPSMYEYVKCQAEGGCKHAKTIIASIGIN